MKDLETIQKINGTSKAEAARAARPWTYANGLDKPPVQAKVRKVRRPAANDSAYVAYVAKPLGPDPRD